jgi:excisionase family DNA binding protein
MPLPQKKRMTPREVAEYLGLTRQSVYYYVRAGKMPFTRIGQTRLLFNRDDIDAWLEASTFRPVVGGDQ